MLSAAWSSAFRRRYYDDQDRKVWVQPQPLSRSGAFGEDALQCLFLLGRTELSSKSSGQDFNEQPENLKSG